MSSVYAELVTNEFDIDGETLQIEQVKVTVYETEVFLDIDQADSLVDDLLNILEFKMGSFDAHPIFEAD